MDPASLSFLQNEIRRFREEFESTKEGNPELVSDRDLPLLAKIVKNGPVGLAFLGIGLLSIAALWRVSSFSSDQKESSALTCHYMTVSLFPGGKFVVKREEAERTGNVHCTTKMLETSSLCGEACTPETP